MNRDRTGHWDTNSSVIATWHCVSVILLGPFTPLPKPLTAVHACEAGGWKGTPHHPAATAEHAQAPSSALRCSGSLQSVTPPPSPPASDIMSDLTSLHGTAKKLILLLREGLERLEVNEVGGDDAVQCKAATT